MYFKREDIEIVKEHVTKHADEIKVILGATDEARFNKAINTILKQKKILRGRTDRSEAYDRAEKQRKYCDQQPQRISR